MIYAPDADADFFCFEPMSHLPNAHNMIGSGGLVTLMPDESLATTPRNSMGRGYNGSAPVTATLRFVQSKALRILPVEGAAVAMEAGDTDAKALATNAADPWNVITDALLEVLDTPMDE